MNKGTPSEKEIAAIKASLPGVALYKWNVPLTKDQVIIFRAIDRPLKDKIQNLIRDAETNGKLPPIEDVQERIFDACVVWPSFTIEEKFGMPVGIVPSLIKSVQEKSGYLDIDIFQRVLAPDSTTSVVKDYEYWGEISTDELDELKASTPFSLYRVRVGRWSFVVRPMTRIDVQIAQQAIDSELAVAKAVVMWPKDTPWDIIPSGIIEILGDKINEVSGWRSQNDTEVEEL